MSHKTNITVSKLESEILKKKLSSMSRYGKTLNLEFSDGSVLIIYLMLRGELLLLRKQDQIPKHQILRLIFFGNDGFAVVDRLEMPTTTLNPVSIETPDALEMKAAYFTQTLAKNKKMVKEVLMDQKKMRGIGYSYADEILSHARISPISRATAIPNKNVK